MVDRGTKRFKDLTGQRFGRLIVLSYAHTNQHGKAIWHCRCDCGNEKDIIGCSLTRGLTKSCGCLHDEKSKDNCKVMSNSNKKHEECKTRLYNIWHGMKARCGNPNNTSYEKYGGKGIKVCDEWQDYLSFREWALNNGYSESLTIDRINNNGNYEPSNCRWATIREQENNRTNNVLLTAFGKTQTMSQWAKEKNICKSTLFNRLKKGWDIEKALNVPSKNYEEENK